MATRTALETASMKGNTKTHYTAADANFFIGYLKTKANQLTKQQA